LRGCIGQVLAEQPLVELVPQMAVRAATADPRFPPLQASELPRVALELSVLSPLGRLYDVAQLAVGVHGLVIEANGRRGLLLPEVPLSRGWDGRQFLQAVCRKAGLPAQAWQWPEANLYTFTAQVFAEPIP
jgi:AmmeMemoRadiSam system protein A